MQHAIKEYLASKELAWAASTRRSETYRLLSVAGHIAKGPNALWQAVEALAPNSRVTLWTSVTNFWGWFKPKEENPFRAFREANRRLFKNAYTRRPASMSYENAQSHISRIADAESAALATFLLESGCRYTESQTFDCGWVLGKGNKRREVLNHYARPIRYGKSYATFRGELAKVGLKPHDLRKIHLTWMAGKGADPFQLMAIAGWSDIKTAMSYVQADREKVKGLYAANCKG